MNIANIGGVTVNNITVKVDGTVAGTYPLLLNAGEEKMLEFDMNVPSSMTSPTNFVLTIEPDGQIDVDMNDNFLTLTLGYVNFSMTLDTKFNDGNTVTVTTDITNNSDFTADTKLLARLGAEDGTVIDFLDFGNFDGRSNKVNEFVFDIDDICPEGEEIPLYFELMSDKTSEYKCYKFAMIHNLNYTILADSLPVGIEPLKMESINSIIVYPNPTKGEVRIEFQQSHSRGMNFIQETIENVEIFDIFGRKLITHVCNSAETTLNVSHLQTGIYFLQIVTSNNTVVRKLVKY
jgi:FlaG/FlaF family flagellin (archaellin)